MQKINVQLSAQAANLAKDAQTASSTGQYPLNSYAFHPRSLVNTLSLFLNYSVEKSKIEQLFVEHHDKEGKDVGVDNTLYLYSSSDPNEKVRRKRVLISSDYRTALKKKYIFDVYFELNQSNWVTESTQCIKMKKFL